MQSLRRRSQQCAGPLRGMLLFRQHLKRNLSNHAGPPRFGIAFDVDGVLVRGKELIRGAPKALQQLYANPSGPGTAQLRVPYVILSNGGGVTEAARASELSQQLGVPISPDQVLLGHTPFKKLADRFRSQRILAVGKGEPDIVMRNYGFQQVVNMDSYVRGFASIDPLASLKPWLQPQPARHDANALQNQDAQVAAVFVVSDPVDWGRDLQVICDVLRSDGHPGRESGGIQTPIYFASDDLEYPTTFPVPRFGMGAFRIALESIYKQVCLAPLIYTSYGKPQVTVYRNAEHVLQQMRDGMLRNPNTFSRELMHGLSFPPPPSIDPPTSGPFKTIYMIGDNPATDIKGAKFAGEPWFSILTRTGCYQEGQPLNSSIVDKVVEDVEEAVQFISKREGLHQL